MKRRWPDTVCNAGGVAVTLQPARTPRLRRLLQRHKGQSAWRRCWSRHHPEAEETGDIRTVVKTSQQPEETAHPSGQRQPLPKSRSRSRLKSRPRKSSRTWSQTRSLSRRRSDKTRRRSRSRSKSRNKSRHSFGDRHRSRHHTSSGGDGTSSEHRAKEVEGAPPR